MDQLSDARLIDLPCMCAPTVKLSWLKPRRRFRIERMFALTAPAGAKRGGHAHRLCSQFMICVSGAAAIVCEDGRKENTFALEGRDQALLVPPGFWNTVEFRQNESVLIVLRDRVYEAHDYIRDYAEFLSFRESVRA